MIIIIAKHYIINIAAVLAYLEILYFKIVDSRSSLFVINMLSYIY